MDKTIDAEQTRKEAGAVILRSYGNFLKHQDTNYKNLQKRSNNILAVQPSISKPFYPIGIDCTPFEHINLLDVIESDNIILNKILAVFSSLCEEIVLLEKEATERHYYFLAFYGEFNREKDITPEESIGYHIENLHLLTAFVKRCHEVVSNFCNQICGLFTSDLISIKGLRLNYVISRLGNILVILVTLDNMVSCSPLKNHWMAYCKAIRSLQQNPTKYNQTDDNLKAFHLVLNMIEDKIINDQIFQNCLSSLATLKKTLVEKNRMQVAQEFLNYIKSSLTELEKSTIDFYESKSAIQWVKVNSLFVFYFHVFGNADKKVFKNLVEINLKAHSIPLYGLAVWHPEQFLLRHAGVLCSTNNKLSQNMAKARHQYINGKKQSLSKDVLNAQLQSSKWSLEVTQTFVMGETNLTASQMTNRMQLLFQGVKFASQINFIITSFISLHMSPGMPVTKSSLMAICKLVEVLKGMNSVFQNNFASIAASVNLIVQHLSYQIISHLISAKKHLIADKNYAKQRLDELTAIVIAERSLRGPATFQRRIVANVALSLVPTQIFADDGLLKIFSLLETEENVINVLSKMNALCDCSFMYWQKSIVPVYFQNVFDSKKDMSRLRLLFQALNDCSKAINSYDKFITNNENSECFDKEMEACFYDTILKPLSQQVETNLRLHIHSHLQLDSMNPFTVPVSDNTSLITMNRFRFDDAYLSISDNVEHYLSYTFYNLTTVVLHNWKTYGEMRQLANFKFALKTVEDHLPTQTLEQGLDVLEIMRNIHIFVSKYLYNLNNQIFIEQSSNNKHLNTINIRHIANSIRTHGTGIMNTTVNFTYQFLKKKFNALNQFMYDEQIKSRLIKDVRQFRKITSETEKRYSYKRAEKFNKDIRTLGCSDDGHSYLDQFRLLISHIGNAMGYVRMVRSGGLHCCANATGFLPSLDFLSRPSLDDNNTDQKTSEVSYIDLWKEDDPDSFVKESVNNLDMTINNLTSNFSQGTEYFQLLVDAFSPDLRNPDRLYLKTFHMIVPPLMLNFIEHMLLCKDKMNKKNISGAAFTDDGFSMGLAFILKLLDQYTEMDSLHWFKSVNAYIAQERASIKDQLSRGPAQLQQPLELTKKKLNVLEQEFQLLYFSFSSARIFFQ